MQQERKENLISFEEQEEKENLISFNLLVDLNNSLAERIKFAVLLSIENKTI